jgi:iron complex outermembrane receptor protein
MRYVWILLLLFMATLSWAKENPSDLTELPLEDLMNIEITSVSKKQQKLSDAAAAIFVITQEDIRRSGATSIPEALRMAPGVEVAHIDANKWAITVRGFNSRFANKLLILIDGRTVYSPLFSGVFWDVQDTLLEDIDRIEVIRGPGATLWGANAVNGVINIITKHAKDTQGGLVSAGTGAEEKGFGEIRYGGKFGNDTQYRFFGKYFNRDSAADTSEHKANDGWDMLRGGFRLDSKLSALDSITLQGDIYRGQSGETLAVASVRAPFIQTFDDDIHTQGGNILGRWIHTFSKSSEMVFQMYYDRTERQESINGEKRNTLDIDLQHRFALGERQEVVWGLGYRFTRDNIKNSFPVSFNPDQRTNHLFSGFVQDDIVLFKDRLRLTLGSKFEDNDFTGFEIQPNVRMLWTPGSRHSLWGAVSRAVHTPARADVDLRVNASVIPPLVPPNPGPLPAYVTLFGNPDLKSEELVAYELGYRFQATSRLSFDIASFYNVYDHLRSAEPGTPSVEASPPPPHLLFPLMVSNQVKGKTYGVEVAADWRLLEWWRIQASYSYLQIRLNGSESLDPTAKVDQGRSPHHQFHLRSSMDLRRDLECNLNFRFVDKLPDFNVKSYASLDARLAWRPHPNLELAIVGQNLLSNHHAEFKGEAIISSLPTEVERSVYGKITWRF